MGATLLFPAMQIDLERRSVVRADGGRERLTQLEVSVLEYLASHLDRVVPRQELMDQVWGHQPSVLSRACDNTIARLRAKIELDPSEPEVLLTVHGVGYRLVGAPIPAPSAPPAPEAGAEVVERRVVLGDRVLDLVRARIEGPQSTTSLTANELALLEALLAAGGAVIERDALQRRIWGSAAGRGLVNTVARLRRKLEPDPARPRHLVTTSLGYRLELGQPSEPSPRPSPPGGGQLPAEVDARFGRDEQIALLEERFRAGDRWVTLVGPGGIGKTRLALAAARHLARVGAVSAGWIDLTEARTVDRICAAFASALRLQLGDGDPLPQIGHALQSLGPAVLVLDNLEQLLPTGEGQGADGVQALASLLGQAGEAWFLATSRKPLRIRGERRVAVEPLATDEANALFVDRAVRALDPGELAEVGELVEELERVPLAIELAAARTAALRVSEIRSRTADRLQLLAVRDPSRPARQQSLRASLDASWVLTSEEARSALAELTVFGGGFTLDSAEEVLSPRAGCWAVDLLEELIDAGLVRRESGAERLSIAVIVRDYAAEHLGEADRALAEARHGRAMAALCSPEILGALDGPQGIEQRRALTAELENLLSAAERAIARGEGPVAVDTATGAWEVLELCGPYRLVEGLLDPLLALPLDAELRARARVLAGRIQRALGRLDPAEEHLVEAARLARLLGSARIGAEAHLLLAGIRVLQERPDLAESDANVALALARELGARILQGRALVALGKVRGRMYQVADGLRVLQAALELAIESGATRCEAEARLELGALLDHAGRQEAGGELGRAVRLAGDLGDRRLEGQILLRLASHRKRQGDRVTERLFELCERFRALGDGADELRVLLDLGLDLTDHHRDDEAERILERASQLAATIGADWARDEALLRLGGVALNHARFEQARELLDRALATARQHGNRRKEASAMDLCAQLAERQGDHVEARRLWEEALAICESIGALYGVGLLSFRLADQALDAGEFERAFAAYERARIVAREHGFPVLEVGSLANQAEARLRQGALALADAAMAEADALTQAMDNPRLRLEVLMSHIDACLQVGARERARTLLEEADRAAAGAGPHGFADRRGRLRERLVAPSGATPVASGPVGESGG